MWMKDKGTSTSCSSIWEHGDFNCLFKLLISCFGCKLFEIWIFSISCFPSRVALNSSLMATEEVKNESSDYGAIEWDWILALMLSLSNFLICFLSTFVSPGTSMTSTLPSESKLSSSSSYSSFVSILCESSMQVKFVSHLSFVYWTCYLLFTFYVFFFCVL